MRRLRSYYDADRVNNQSVPTSFETILNKNEINCSVCAATVFVDDLIFDDVKKVIENTSENSFMCEDCLSEYDEMAHRA
jgi:uncharacterized protein YlaI